ncbi:HNH endonuclease [Halorientalis pallida]|uniref:HNH endonuclease n=1 Tax=Halorientalis pallida TaxID=2479928 RepID=UPI003C6F0CF6
MECPTCGKSLTTERGVKQHHTKVHDDPLPNRECAGCGTEFYDPKARLTYCDDCNPNSGEHNGNWNDAKETTECERCGDEFEYYPSDKKGVYCPTCVEEADDFLGTHYADVHDIEPVSRECKQCGKQFEILPCFTRDGDRKFCDHDCLSSWLSEEWGDGTAVYNGDWRSIRRRALERDDHQCRFCSKDRDEMGRNPDVHHIRPVRDFDDPQDAHVIDNVISLCRSCHGLAEHGSIPASVLSVMAKSRNP